MQTSGRDGTHTEVIIALCSLTPEGNPHDHRVGFYGCLNMSPPLLHIERSWLRSYEEASRRTWWKLLSLYYFYIQIIISQTSEGKLFHLLTLIFLARCDSCDGNTDTFCFVRSSFARLTVFFFHITILAKDRTIFRGRDVNLSHSNCTRYLKCCKLRHFRVNKCFYGFNTELHVSILLSHNTNPVFNKHSLSPVFIFRLHRWSHWHSVSQLQHRPVWPRSADTEVIQRTAAVLNGCG